MAAKRRYTDEERAKALTALAANGDDVPRTARQLGIPYQTLVQWHKGHRHPEALQMSEPLKKDMATRLDELGELIVGDLANAARRKKAGYLQLATTLGIAIDKARLLRGQPTSIIEQNLKSLSDEDLDREIADLEGVVVAAQAGAAGPPPAPAKAG